MEPSERDLAELTALADGTLPAEQRADVEARVAASAELRERLRRQRQAVAATRALAEDTPSASLRAAVEAQLPTRRSRRVAPRIAVAGAIGIAAAIVFAVLTTGGPGGPTVAEAAAIGTRPATAPAPRPLDGTGLLALRLEGVSFPDFTLAGGWRPVGVRHDSLDGRKATVVFYEKGTRRIAYVIVSGSTLPWPEGSQSSSRLGVRYETLLVGDELVVTWRRGGHTCVLLGAVPRAELLALASY